MLTASWLLRCSHNPSDAKMRKLSPAQSFRTCIDGSARRIGFSKVPGTLNFGSKGSLLNSDFFKYASPSDLETSRSHEMKVSQIILILKRTQVFSL